jgi:hypothetical protein
MKEPWDYAEFVRCYNAIARARAGNDYDGLLTPEKLARHYELGTATTIREFAERCFTLDQEY